MMRGKVTAVDASGVYVQTAEYGTLGPCQAVVANYAVGDMVLCVNVGDEASPELVVVGRLTGTGSTTSGSSVDNTVARYNGTGGALQGSGVTIDDSARMYLATPAGEYAYIEMDSPDNDAYLSMDGADPSNKIILYKAGGKTRFTQWVSGTDQNWFIQRHDADGNAVSTPLFITRSTGRVTLGDVGATAGLEMGSGGPTWTVGTGVPSHSAPNGSLHSRTDGGSGTTLYVRESGSWVGK